MRANIIHLSRYCHLLLFWSVGHGRKILRGAAIGQGDLLQRLAIFAQARVSTRERSS
jgi:hypothetical protein